MNVLVIFAHPALERSRVNRALLGAVRAVPGVTLHDLYEAYPDFDIDVRREQTLLLAHDVVIFQHPFYWYAAPALVKEWQDLVLEHGWAYGHEGRALVGKITCNVLTAGGPASAYRPEGLNRFPIRQLLTPFEATANLCGMTFLPPFVVHGTLRLAQVDLDPYVAGYRRLLEALVDDRIDLARAVALPTLHADLDQVLVEPRPALGAVAGKET